MLPLLLVPGAGAELCRGLAGVIVGGMRVSTFLTLIPLPGLLRLGESRYPASRAWTVALFHNTGLPTCVIDMIKRNSGTGLGI